LNFGATSNIVSKVAAGSALVSGLSSIFQLLIVTPKYQGITPQIDGEKSFFFHFEGENTVSQTADVTDHYVEDNAAMHDHITLRPEVVTAQGYIGELNTTVPQSLEALATAANKLTTLSPFLPAISTTALIAYNTAFQLYQTAKSAANAGISAFATISGDSTGSSTEAQIIAGQENKLQTQQQIAYAKFYRYFVNRTLFTVQTPWALHQNMIIQSMRVTQSEETTMISDFELSFKQLRFASTSSGNVAVAASRAASQQSKIEDQGPKPSVPATKSFLSSLGGMITKFGSGV
jgi:hypothetical protein